LSRTRILHSKKYYREVRRSGEGRERIPVRLATSIELPDLPSSL
jgi:hypothetical protein